LESCCGFMAKAGIDEACQGDTDGPPVVPIERHLCGLGCTTIL
jgi:hypothetical protein